jgi:CMP-N,N'-diacetyllegionaminic acid synthase
MRVLAFIPARAGSKSIEHKNMALLGEEHLITYCIEALKDSPIVDKVCSTDSETVANLARRKGIEVLDRPKHLAKADTPIGKVLTNFIDTYYGQDEERHDAIALIQPTSPFLTPYQITQCITRLKEEPDLQSVQTVCKVPHNYHAWNQRVLRQGRIEWAYPQREWAYNKEKKPALYKFGNLVITRTESLTRGDVFAQPSGAVVIGLYDSLDIDGKDDLAMADALIKDNLLGLWES